jgi:acetyltransferase
MIRPIRPEDEPLMVKFHATLSDQTVYHRYLQMLKLSQRVAHERLTRIGFIDYARERALVAERTDAATGEKQIIGVGRLQRLRGMYDAEFAGVLSDSFHGQGLGCELVKRLLEVAHDEQYHRVIADILLDNFRMQHVCEKLGVKLEREPGAPTVSAEYIVGS